MPSTPLKNAMPPGARLQLRSRSGNTLNQVYDFYDRKGDQVTEEKWNSSPKVLRGPIDTMVVVGEDWSDLEYDSDDSRA